MSVDEYMRANHVQSQSRAKHFSEWKVRDETGAGRNCHSPTRPHPVVCFFKCRPRSKVGSRMRSSVLGVRVHQRGKYATFTTVELGK
jgi:hypothetical protein